MTGLGRRAGSGAAWLTIEMATTQALSLMIFTIMAHFLDASDFGLVSLTFVLLMTIKMVLLDQISTAVTRKQSATHREYSTIFWITLLVGAVGFLFLNAFSLLADRIFDARGLGKVVRSMSCILLAFSAMGTQEQWLARHFNFRVLAVRSIGGSLCGGLAGIACASMGAGVWSLVAQQLTMSAVSMALLWSTCPWRPRFEFCPRTARDILDYMRRIMGGSVLFVVNQNCDVVMIGMLYGPTSVGIYSVGKRLAVALNMVAATPINGVTMPTLAEAQDDAHQLRTILFFAIRGVLSICAPIFLGAVALDQEIILTIFGHKWAGAVSVFGWLALATLCAMTLQFNNTVFSIKNHPIWTTYISVVYSVLAFGLFYALNLLGFHLIALPFVLPYVVILPVSVVLVCRVTGTRVRTWISAVQPPVLSAIVMFVVVRWLDHLMPLPTVDRLLLCIAIGAVTYVGLMAVLVPSLLEQGLRLGRDWWDRRTRSTGLS